MAGYGFDNQGSITGRGEIFRYCVQISSAAHPDYYLMGTGKSSLWIRTTGA
jgi:hypothetical protein